MSPHRCRDRLSSEAFLPQAATSAGREGGELITHNNTHDNTHPSYRDVSQVFFLDVCRESTNSLSDVYIFMEISLTKCSLRAAVFVMMCVRAPHRFRKSALKIISGEGGGVLDIIHGRSRVTIGPRVSATAGTERVRCSVSRNGGWVGCIVC